MHSKSQCNHRCVTRCVTLTTPPPSYITTNRLGIYLFQIRIPHHFRHNSTFFRKSLGTRNRSEALGYAKRLWVMLDFIEKQFFDDEKYYHKALKLLGQYNLLDTSSWDNVEAFLMELDEFDCHLLAQAQNVEYIRYKSRPAAETDARILKVLEQTNERLNKHEQNNNEIINRLDKQQEQLDSKPTHDLIEIYIDERSRRLPQKNIKKYINDIRPKLKLITDILSVINADELKTSHIIQYKKTVFELPSNRTKGVYANKTIQDITQMDIQPEKRLAPETIKSNFNKVSAFLDWLHQNNYAIAGLNQALKNAAPPSKPDHEQRPAFTPDELTRLFESPQYIQGKHRKASHYWVPLLALFTGARQNELCQLYKTDVYEFEDSGIWVLNINENSKDKSLKRSHHARLVPIHKKLISMGFKEYVESVNHERIFPDLEFKRDGYGQKFSRWFCDTYLNERNCNIKKKGGGHPVFHSFRHTVVTQLDHEHSIPDHHIAHLVGQKPPGNSVTTNRYIKPKDLQARQTTIKKLTYLCIDFEKIRTWEIKAKIIR